MVARVATVAFQGIDTLEIDVQVHLANTMPAFSIVGLPAKAVDESCRPGPKTWCTSGCRAW